MLLVSILKHKMHGEKTKRVQVTFTERQWEVIERFKGIMGISDAETVRNIVVSWLAEKSAVSSAVKKESAGSEQDE